jgi:signal transduction histidine kinase
MAAVATAPIYSPISTQMGTGIVGGQMSSFEATGRQAGEIVKQLLQGVPLSSPKLRQVMPSQFHVDWRQIKRWGIDEDDLPSGTIVHFREPSLWEMHRTEMTVFLVMLLAQALLIAWLLLERRMRRRMELQAAQDSAHLVHMDRVAMMGALSASLSHELNQPLTAILANAEAGQRLSMGMPGKLIEAVEIFEDIVSEALRAAEYIRSLRGLFKQGKRHIQQIDMNELIDNVLGLIASELLLRRISLVRDFSSQLPVVSGDRSQRRPCADGASPTQFGDERSPGDGCFYT